MQSLNQHEQFIEKVKHALKFECGFYSVANSAVMVGLSGGPDSVALLKALKELVDEDKLYAVHINHMLRGQKSLNDQLFCKNLCQQLNVEFYTFDVDVEEYSKKEKLSIEVAARDLRHLKFKEVARKIKDEKGYPKVIVAVGHNMNDRAETVLLNMGRGTALKGLCSMDFVNSDGNIIRPLLGITRDEIEEFAKDFSPVTDHTNLETEYTRNKIRLMAMPLLNEIFDRDMTKMLSDMSELLKVDNDYIEEQAKDLFDKYFDYDTNCLNADFIKEQHLAVAYRIIRNAILCKQGNLVNISSDHIEDIYRLCANNKSSKKIHLPNGIQVEYKYNRLYFKTGEELSLDCKCVPVDMNNIEYEVIDAADVCVEKFDLKAHSMCFDLDVLMEFAAGDEITFRYRLPGDVVKIYRGSGSKKLKKFFIDNKVDCNIREDIPLLAVNNNIIWVVGHLVDDRFVVTTHTKRILKIEFNK